MEKKALLHRLQKKNLIFNTHSSPLPFAHRGKSETTNRFFMVGIKKFLQSCYMKTMKISSFSGLFWLILAPKGVLMVTIYVHTLSMVPLIWFRDKWRGNVFSIDQEMDFSMDMSAAHTVMDPVIIWPGKFLSIHSSPKEVHIDFIQFSWWPWVTDPDPGSCQICHHNISRFFECISWYSMTYHEMQWRPKRCLYRDVLTNYLNSCLLFFCWPSIRVLKFCEDCRKMPNSGIELYIKFPIFLF